MNRPGSHGGWVIPRAAARGGRSDQLLDVDGVRVVRASDLYLAAPGQVWRLVGVDVSWVSFLRRALPGRSGRHPSPAQVLDWSGVQPFGVAEGEVRLRVQHAGVHRVRPAELADLLEDLGRVERSQLVGALAPAAASDALEEMHASDRRALLRDASVEDAAAWLTGMERDDAVDALRDLPDAEREGVLDAMPGPSARELRVLLSYPERTAGGLMSSAVVQVPATGTVADAVAAVRATAGLPDQHPAVAVVDPDGRLVDDITAVELLGSTPRRRSPT